MSDWDKGIRAGHSMNAPARKILTKSAVEAVNGLEGLAHGERSDGRQQQTDDALSLHTVNRCIIAGSRKDLSRAFNLKHLFHGRRRLHQRLHTPAELVRHHLYW